MRLFRADAESLPVEGHLAEFDGATGWLNSEPLTPEALRGQVVLVDFWTYTCINWLRTLGFVRAWAEKYAAHGAIVVGVHTPEFPFERDVDNIRREVQGMHVEYPVAIDSDYGVWTAFSNHYWPALYIADAEGRIRHHQFGEGGYEECERVVQQLLREAGRDSVPDDVVSPELDGFEVQADWANLRSPETYLGYEQAQTFSSPEGTGYGDARAYSVPSELRLNHWALEGDWAIGAGAVVLEGDEGTLAVRFHARDVNLVMGPRARGDAVPYRVLVDGEPPGDGHGFDVDERGEGTLTEQRLHQLVRQRGSFGDRTVEVRFLAPGAEAYCLTFG